MGHSDMAVVTDTFGYTGGYVTRRLIGNGVRVRTLSRRLAGANPLCELPKTPCLVSCTQRTAGALRRMLKSPHR